MRLRGSATSDPAAGDGAPTEPRVRRPWFLISAALLLAVLVVVLWAKWAETRGEAQRLRAELRQVYQEAETLRMQSAQAQQRLGVLEKELRTLRARDDKDGPAKGGGAGNGKAAKPARRS